MIIRNKFLFVVLFLFECISSVAQCVSVSFEPKTLALGENLRLEYKINSDKASGIRTPSFSGFDVLSGPFSSTYSNYQMINGRSRSSSSTTYTFILSPNKIGTIVIPPTTISIGNRNIATPSVRINVIKGAGKHSRSTVGGSSNPSLQPSAKTFGKISSGDLFITIKANKNKIFEQEPVLLTYKVYTLVNLTQLSGKMPEMQGFLSQEVKLPQQKTFSAERLNGKLYRTTTWSQYVVFPQQTGKLTIPAIKFDGIVEQIDNSIDPFDAFFNGGANAFNVKVSRYSPELSLQVLPLPAKPNNFSGGVGNFSIKGCFVNTVAKTNEALTYRIIVSGIGNMKLIKNPIIKFPASFETFDPKVTDQTKLTTNGIEGNMVFDYLLVPKQKGTFEISPVSLVYFNVNTNSYQTIYTNSCSINVQQGTKTDADIENDMKLRASDLKPLDKASIKTSINTDLFFGSIWFWMAYLSLIVIFVAAFVILRKYQISVSDAIGRKKRRAGKLARQRMKKAKIYMQTNDSAKFYEEISSVLLNFASDKFKLSNAQLNKEIIISLFMDREIRVELIDEYINILEYCEFARFAPKEDFSRVKDLYEQTYHVIEQLDQALKK